MKQQSVDSKWWVAHLAVTIGVFLQLAAIPISLQYGSDHPVIYALFMTSIGLIIVFILPAIVGYWAEADALEEADADWQPNPWVWFLGGFLVGQVLLMPIYLIRRWDKVGLDWGQVPIVRRAAA
jgi:hypothetical protein